MTEPLTRSVVPPAVVLGLLDLADRQRVDPTGWFAGTGLTRELLEQPEALVSYRQSAAIIRRAQRALAAGPIGLALGSRDILLSWGILGTVLRSAPTGEEALRAGLEYHQGSGTLVDYSLSTTDDVYVLELIPRSQDDSDLLPFLAEEGFTAIVVLLRRVFGPSGTPHSAELDYPPPTWSASYERLWDCPVQFNAGRNALLIPRALEKRRIPTANAAHFEAALSAVRRILASTGDDDVVATVEAVLRSNHADGLSAGAVAARLNMSERTLQRRLRQAGFGFADLRDRVRMERARRLLRETDQPVSMIANAVGFSDAREFRRAYKRWTGRAPSCDRAE